MSSPMLSASQILKKSLLGMQTMAALQKFEYARNLSTNAESRDEALNASKENCALFHGVDGKSVPYSGFGKQDTDYPTGAMVSDLSSPLYTRARVAVKADPMETAVVAEMLSEFERCVLIVTVRNGIKCTAKLQPSIGTGSFIWKYFGESYAYVRGALQHHC